MRMNDSIVHTKVAKKQKAKKGLVMGGIAGLFTNAPMRPRRGASAGATSPRHHHHHHHRHPTHWNDQ
jgi:hypothetical protein